ncbi:uncharacterized protein LOC142625347 [Castanea sativa]|uniref:uncharacterized protein LOC142625347 n=1 Tax=Castanea sativa TaxID=21020 RepID=UPI003F653C9B
MAIAYVVCLVAYWLILRRRPQRRQDCIGAIDGTHIRAKVPIEDAPRYHGRKDYPTQNVLAACKYCLVDAGFMLRSTPLAPYRGVHYHLKEYSRNPPQNPKELFNLRHASLCNAIERAFGVLKKSGNLQGDHTLGGSGLPAKKAKHKAKEFKNKPIPNYDKLVELYGKDRATGEQYETASEMRQQWATSIGEGSMGNIEDIDHLVAQNEVTLESCDNVGEASSKAKKRKTSKNEDMEQIMGAIQNVALAMRDGNLIFERSMARLPIPEQKCSISWMR